MGYPGGRCAEIEVGFGLESEPAQGGGPVPSQVTLPPVDESPPVGVEGREVERVPEPRGRSERWEPKRGEAKGDEARRGQTTLY
jgi:hypothetical protein